MYSLARDDVHGNLVESLCRQYMLVLLSHYADGDDLFLTTHTILAVCSFARHDVRDNVNGWVLFVQSHINLPPPHPPYPCALKSKRKAPSHNVQGLSKKASAAAIAAAAAAAALNAASSPTSHEDGSIADVDGRAVALSKSELAAANGQSGLNVRNVN